MATRQLIIFVKNPIPGTVKTRIARTVGPVRAADVYRHLLAHTQEITQPGTWQNIVYYADFVNPDDGWNGCEKAQQTGHDLGERIANAFRERFAAGAAPVVIIGSDCLEISAAHLMAAFGALEKTDVVIGPATDGGYYLLGMNRMHDFLSEAMPWSQPDLYERTQQAIQQNNLTLHRLPTLSDIDEWSDYERAVQAKM